MTSDRQALLAAVLAAPEDDAPRIVYADFIEENGDEVDAAHAELIRVQVGIARLNLELHSDEDCWDARCPGCRERRAFEDRQASVLRNHPVERDMVRAFGVELKRGVSHGYGGFGANVGAVRWEWARGFVETVLCPCDTWMRYGPAVVRAAPVTRVELSDKRPHNSSVFSDAVWFMDGLPTTPQHAVPEALFRLLPGIAIPYVRPAAHKSFGTIPEAIAALSAACLEYAHEKTPAP